MSRMQILKDTVITAHRLSRGLDRRQRMEMFLTVTRYAQEDEGADFADILAILTEAINKLETKKILFSDKLDEWLDQLRNWVRMYENQRVMDGYVFIPVHDVRNWLRENRIHEEAAIDALRMSGQIFSQVEAGDLRYSRKVRMGGKPIRCMGFDESWVHGTNGEDEVL